MSHFTNVERLQTEVEVTRLFDESGKAIRRNHGNKLPRENGLDLITNHRPALDRASTGIAHRFEFPSSEEHSRVLDDMFSADVYVRDSCKLFPKNFEMRVRSQNSHVKVNPVCLVPIVSAASVPSDVHPVELGIPISGSGTQSVFDVETLMPLKVITEGAISN